MSRSISCLHLADIHFGMETHGFTNPQTGLNTRLEDFRDSLSQAIDYAIEHELDLAVFAGDAYKRNNPNPTEQRELVAQFARLADAGIPTVMISGNHDIPVMQGKAASIDIFRSIQPGMFHVFVNEATQEPRVIETRKGPIAVCAFPYISPSHLRSLPPFQKKQGDEFIAEYERFFHETLHNMLQQIPQDIPRLLAAHITVRGASFGGYRGVGNMIDDIQIHPAELAEAGFDYVALGHIHRHQNLTTNTAVPVVYPGSIDRVDFSEAGETKGFVVAEIRRGGATYSFLPLDVRPMVHVEVAAEEDVPITDCLIDAIECERIDGAIVKVTFVADEEEMRDLDMKRVHQALQSAHFKVGLQRIPKNEGMRKRNASLSTEVSVQEALNAYIREHGELKADAPALMAKAREIEKSVQKMDS
ncbi:exonuclease subunit SbcD [bacterium]|nr:exonuclease subunit SbcD [bacterium]